MYYRFGEKTVLVTHGGLSLIPDNLTKVAYQAVFHRCSDFAAAYRQHPLRSFLLRYIQQEQLPLAGFKNVKNPDKLKDYLKRKNVTLVFECVDMANDPHI